ncbi:MAG TPA: nucleoside triphosphate pyrophosphohydrolase [Steroidobacteraceae bacterium]
MNAAGAQGEALGEAQTALAALLALMARLRDPAGGCPWDRQQTFATIAPYTLEEAYEVADAIDRNDRAQLRDELGDLLFQIVFHCQLASERGWFDFTQVASTIHAKLVRRHPHLFGGPAVADAQQQTRSWESLKAEERAALARTQDAPDHSALAHVPQALPALARAAKLGRRAARVGFDWQQPAQVRAKVLEELHEVDAALTQGDATHVAEEVGDLLFAVANWTLHLQIDPEEALRAANRKFERRFRHMERLAGAQGRPLESLSAAEWDELWSRAKSG